MTGDYVVPSKETLEKADAMLAKADVLMEQVRELEVTRSRLLNQRSDLINRAFESIVPFKVGDVIEYQTWQGYSPHRKLVTKRMKVNRMRRGAYGGVGVHGSQADKNGDVNGRDAYSELFVGKEGHDIYVGVLKEAE